MRRHPWLVVALAALLGVVGLGAFPARAYLDQQRQHDELARQVEELSRTNAGLEAERDRLGSPEAVEQLARQRYQLVRPGEEAYVILPDGNPLPASAGPASPDTTQPQTPKQSWWNKAWSKLLSIL